MSYLLEILGRGLIAELSAAFRELLSDDDDVATCQRQLLVAQNPNQADPIRDLGVRYLTERQFRKAKEMFLQAIAINPNDTRSRAGLACTLDELGDTRSAINHLEKAAMGNDDVGTHFALGFCLEKIGESARAIASYQNALDITPQLRNAHERIAAIHLKLDNVQDAIQHYEHLCWCEPDDLATGLTLASLYVKERRYNDAIRRYELVITIDPDNWEAKDDFVSACVEAGRYDDALRVLKSLIQQKPDRADQHLKLGDVYSKMSRPDQALDEYRKAVEINPDYLEAAIKVGTLRFKGGHYIEAAHDFHRAIEINDRIVDAYVGLSVALQAIGKTEEAQSTIDMAAEIEPNSTLLFGEMARLQLQVTAHQQITNHLSPHAITDSLSNHDNTTEMVTHQISNLQTALIDHPNHADMHFRLGVLLAHNGNLPAAIDAYTAAVSINPQYLKAMTRLGLALHEAGRLDEARDTLKRAIDIDPHSVNLHYQVGLIFADRNEFALAVDRFDYAAAKQPNNQDYVANLALALQNMGLIDRAEASWQTLCDVSKESDTTSLRS